MSTADKLTTIAKNMPKVYEAGQKSEYDDFWDNFQDRGNRTMYAYGFSGLGWSTEVFKPKYDMQPLNAGYMFARWNDKADQNINVAETLEKLGRVLDTSKNTTFGYFLMYGATPRLPVIDTTRATSLNNFSVNSSIFTIDKIILKDDGSQLVKTMFSNDHPNLTDVVIEGVIGNDINLQTCTKLTVESLISFLKALKDFAGSTDEYTRTISLTDEQWVKLGNEGATAPNGRTWLDYVEDKCWST